MKKNAFLCLVLVLVLGLVSDDVARADPCDCEVSFAHAQQVVETAYLGYAHLTEANDRAAYQRHRDRYAADAAKQAPETCTAWLQGYLDFFDDGHLFVIEQPVYTPDQETAFEAEVRAHVPGEAALWRTLERQATDPLTGWWYDAQSLMAVIQEGDDYVAYVVRSKQPSMQGIERKAVWRGTPTRLEGTYFSDSHGPRHIRGGLYKQQQQLVWTGGIVWARLPEVPSSSSGLPADWPDPALPTISNVDSNTMLLTIPSFLVDASTFNEILLARVDELLGAHRVVIDIRGNTGGNALYFSFLGAYAERPLPPSQGEVWASPYTLEYYRARAGDDALYADVAQRIEEHMGEVIPGPAYPGRKYDEPMGQVQRVAILMDEGCMSAAESFVLHSQAVSPRVTTFGRATAGVIDYTSVHSFLLDGGGSRRLYMGIPTSSLHEDIPQRGYNATGIVPQVPLLLDHDPVAEILRWWDQNAG